jgi:putative DNA primase/helicase
LPLLIRETLYPSPRTLHEKYPEKPIVIAGDDDKHLDLTHGINPGRSKAEEAARAVGGKVLLPIFAPNENSYPAGLETVTPQKFRQGQLCHTQHDALAKMKQYTDFNDLATKSVLGSEAVKRQVQPIVESLTERRQAFNLQDKKVCSRSQDIRGYFEITTLRQVSIKPLMISLSRFGDGPR